MNINIKKILLVSLGLLILSGCASKDYSSNDYQGLTAKQILQQGERAITKHNYSAAIKYFEAIDALYPFDAEAEQGQLNVIYAYYKAEDYASALAAANRYIHLYPEGSHTDYAYYMKGIINFDKDRTMLHKLYPRDPEKLDITNLHAAYVNFEEMLKKFPNSKRAHDAEKRMIYICYLLAEHELYIAKFYLERKAYIAAANRAGYIVKHFAGVPQIKEALKIMIKSYRFLGLDKQTDDALRILRLNFPHEKV